MVLGATLLKDVVAESCLELVLGLPKAVHLPATQPLYSERLASLLWVVRFLLVLGLEFRGLMGLRVQQ